jgi:hypothetical protein
MKAEAWHGAGNIGHVERLAAAGREHEGKKQRRISHGPRPYHALGGMRTARKVAL